MNDYNFYYKNRYLFTRELDDDIIFNMKSTKPKPCFITLYEIILSGYTSKDIIYNHNKKILYIIYKINNKSVYLETYDVYIQRNREQKINELLK